MDDPRFPYPVRGRGPDDLPDRDIGKSVEIPPEPITIEFENPINASHENGVYSVQIRRIDAYHMLQALKEMFGELPESR